MSVANGMTVTKDRIVTIIVKMICPKTKSLPLLLKKNILPHKKVPIFLRKSLRLKRTQKPLKDRNAKPVLNLFPLREKDVRNLLNKQRQILKSNLLKRLLRLLKILKPQKPPKQVIPQIRKHKKLRRRQSLHAVGEPLAVALQKKPIRQKKNLTIRHRHPMPLLQQRLKVHLLKRHPNLRLSPL
ncbi:3-hydroxyacyl- dehydrogenase [Lasius niger]|uniref:3-hydroxyacyl-dehydrogenase n=1 Tax=Lasius niger TaxID=67767 RepID=A0A0J7KCW6_LASNI|nr:3-hydroxyacyl- dehydrogenase [Lasius niger]